MAGQNESRLARSEGFFEGGFAAGISVFLLVASRVVFDGPVLSEVLGEWLIGLLPGAVFSAMLGQVEFAGKPLLHVGIGVGAIGAGAVAGRLYTRWNPSIGRFLSGLVILTTALWFGLLPVLGVGNLGVGRPASPPLWLSTGAAALLTILLLEFVTRRSADATSRSSTPGRRRVIFALSAGVSVVGSALVWRLLDRVQSTNSPAARPASVAAAPSEHPIPEYTPVGVFYNVSKNMLDPRVDEDSFRLRIIGDVDTEFEVTLAELRAMPAVEQSATLCCISNEVGGDLIGHAIWKGVRLRDLLNRAGVRPGSVDIVFHCRDEYRDSIALADALKPETIVVYDMNGSQLTSKHGFPLRVIVPGIYGMKNAKWVDRIQVVDNDFKGFWQVQGWNDQAHYQTMSRIDRPQSPRDRAGAGPRPIHGIAFAGDRGISRVELSVDGGATWFDAVIRPPVGPFSWVRWSSSFTPEVGERRVLMVRATDGGGQTQTDTYATPFPNGSTGYHTISVSIEGL